MHRRDTASDRLEEASADAGVGPSASSLIAPPSSDPSGQLVKTTSRATKRAKTKATVKAKTKASSKKAKTPTTPTAKAKPAKPAKSESKAKAKSKTKKKAKSKTKTDDKALPESTAAQLTAAELKSLSSKRGLLHLMRSKRMKTRRVLRTLQYEEELERLQIEMVKLQQSVQTEGRRIVIICEGRDAAGKGGTIRRFMEHLNPRTARVVALPKPTREEKGQWYFRRYVRALPNPGEICFFDRSWYNRAVVEPVMSFCDKDQYHRFMRQVPEFEHMLYEDGIELIKFWFSISKDEQAKRFAARRENPLKQWKISPVDEVAQQHWNSYTKYKERMFSSTHTTFSPWIIVRANLKRHARLESMRYVLSQLEYKGKEEPVTHLQPDPSIVRRFHRSVKQID
jgi:polyphosphate kinase 2